MAAVALIVIEVVTLSSGRPASSSRMSSRVSMATPTLPTSPSDTRVVRVVAHLGGQVEGARQPGLAGVQQELEPLVRGLGGAEAGVLAHRPQATPVHVGADPTRVGERAGGAQPLGRIPSCEVVGPVDLLDGDAGVGDALVRGLAGGVVGCHGPQVTVSGHGGNLTDPRSPAVRDPTEGVLHGRTTTPASRGRPGSAGVSRGQPAGASITCGMHRSSYSAITSSPASAPHAGHCGSRRTLNVRKLCSSAS